MNHPISINEIKQRFQNGHYQGTIDACQAVISIQQAGPDVYYLLASALDRIGELPAAINALQKAIHLAPAHIAFKRELLRMTVREDNSELLLHRFESIPVTQREASDYLIVAQNQWANGAYSEALNSFKGAFDRDHSGQFSIRLAQAYYQLGQIRQGLDVLEQSLQRNQNDPNLLFYQALGRCHNQGVEAALQGFEQTLSIQPEHQLAWIAKFLLESSLGKALTMPSKVKQLIAVSPQLAAFVEGTLRLFPGQSESQACTLSVPVMDAALAAAKPGLQIECGVYWGRSIRYIAQKTKATVHGFDSFEGLPENWKDGEAKGAYSTHGVMPRVPAEVKLYPGWFDQTLPEFIKKQSQQIGLLHIDCDLYSSTRTVLQTLHPLIGPGTVIVLDDYMGYPGYQQHEYKAFHEYCDQNKLKYEYLSYCFLGREVAVRMIN